MNLLCSTTAAAIAALGLVSGCAVGTRPPIRTESAVDLQRFMGDWYVIASIPTSIEEEAYNAVESYRLNEDGTIDTTFTFLDGGFDGEPKRYSPRGFVFDTKSNAVWGMQFFWPIKADYRIVYVSADYSTTIVGRDKRDYVWIMARTPEIDEAELQALLGMAGSQGYAVERIRKVPQRWTTP